MLMEIIIINVGGNIFSFLKPSFIIKNLFFILITLKFPK